MTLCNLNRNRINGKTTACYCIGGANFGSLQRCEIRKKEKLCSLVLKQKCNGDDMLPEHVSSCESH